MEVPLRGFRGLERFRAGKRQAWTPIKSHGCGLGMPVAKKDKFHTCGGPRRRPCLGEGRGRRITIITNTITMDYYLIVLVIMVI